MFESSVLRRIFEPKRDKVTGEWIKLHNVGLNYLHSSRNIVRMIKLRRMRWVGHAARIGADERCIQVFGGETRGKETTWKTQA